MSCALSVSTRPLSCWMALGGDPAFSELDSLHWEGQTHLWWAVGTKLTQHPGNPVMYVVETLSVC